jgi:hypothetical protein
MTTQPRSFTIERDENPHGVRAELARLDDGQQYQLPASAYRLLQAEELLREMGYVEQADGIWLLP